MRTKWDLVEERLVEAQKALDNVKAELEWMTDTPFAGECSGCGEKLLTEKDFAQHYVIPDERYPNLGNCPNR